MPVIRDGIIHRPHAVVPGRYRRTSQHDGAASPSNLAAGAIVFPFANGVMRGIGKHSLAPALTDESSFRTYEGVRFKWWGGTNRTDFTGGDWFDGTTECSALAVVRINNYTAGNYDSLMRFDLTATFIQLHSGAGAHQMTVWPGGTAAVGRTTSAFPLNQNVVVIMTWRSGEAFNIYWDGVDQSLSVNDSTTGAIANWAGSKPFIFGEAESGLENTDGGIAFAAAWPKRKLSIPEIRSLSENPWQMFTGGTRLIHAEVNVHNVGAVVPINRYVTRQPT